jgi:hypothetical protein
MAPLAIGNKRCNRDEDLSTAWVAQLVSLKDPYGPLTGNVQWSKSSATALWRVEPASRKGVSAPLDALFSAATFSLPTDGLIKLEFRRRFEGRFTPPSRLTGGLLPVEGLCSR